MSDDQKDQAIEEPEIEENDPPAKRRHIRHYKREAEMLADCEQFVRDRKRLPILHSRWILNRFVNAGHSLHGLEVALNYANIQLEEERRRNRELRQQLEEYKGKAES